MFGMSFTKIASIQDIKEGMIKSFTVQGKKIAIANVDGEFFAVDDTCTHDECSLGDEGLMDGSTVICGCHGAMFDVTTGKVLALPGVTDVATYEVKVEGDDIMVKL